MEKQYYNMEGKKLDICPKVGEFYETHTYEETKKERHLFRKTKYTKHYYLGLHKCNAALGSFQLMYLHSHSKINADEEIKNYIAKNNGA